MFDFPKWKKWLEAKAVESESDGLTIRFLAGPKDSSKPGIALGIQGNRATGLFQNWHTGETDYTILAPPEGPMVSHKWGVVTTDETFEATYGEFIAELSRFELHS